LNVHSALLALFEAFKMVSQTHLGKACGLSGLGMRFQALLLSDIDMQSLVTLVVDIWFMKRLTSKCNRLVSEGVCACVCVGGEGEGVEIV